MLSVLLATFIKPLKGLTHHTWHQQRPSHSLSRSGNIWDGSFPLGLILITFWQQLDKFYLSSEPQDPMRQLLKIEGRIETKT